MNYADNRQVTIKDSYDVIVAGGGIGGVAAAVAAARNGSKTLLMEKQINLGGLATVGLISWYEPLCDGKGKQVISGICEELIRLSIKYGMEKQIAFNDSTLRYLVEAKNRIPEAVIFYDYYEPDMESLITDALKYGFYAIVIHHHALTPERVKMIQSAGLEAGVWTVDEEEEIQRFLDMGVTRFYSDHISRVFKLKGLK